MSKKCIKCGQPLPDNASFLSSLYSSPEGKTGDKKAPKRWRKAVLEQLLVVFLAAVGAAFSLHHRRSPMREGRRWFIKTKENLINCC